MAVYKYSVEGIYETDKGSGKDYTNFNFDINLARFEGQEDGAGTHILRRFLPILIKKMKNKPFFSSVKYWTITDIQKVSDDFPLEKKNIAELNDYEIQELACMYDLYEVPTPYTTTISEARRTAQQAYLKKVFGIKIGTPEEQLKYSFFKKQEDGTIKFDMGEEELIVEIKNIYKKEKEVVKKTTLSDLIKKAGQVISDGLSVITGDNQKEGNFPKLEDLQ